MVDVSDKQGGATVSQLSLTHAQGKDSNYRQLEAMWSQEA